MKFEPLIHRSDKWYEARRGKPTASAFSRFINAKGALKAEGAKTYEAELIGERLFGRPVGRDVPNTPAVRYGVEREDEAAEKLGKELNTLLFPGGFFTTDDGHLGASPDRRIEVGNTLELVEIKAPEITTQIKHLINGIGEDYYTQVQGQLYVSECDSCHFFSYRHDAPPYYISLGRDEAFIRAMARTLEGFCDRLEENFRKCEMIWKKWNGNSA